MENHLDKHGKYGGKSKDFCIDFGVKLLKSNTFSDILRRFQKLFPKFKHLKFKFLNEVNETVCRNIFTNF